MFLYALLIIPIIGIFIIASADSYSKPLDVYYDHSISNVSTAAGGAVNSTSSSYNHLDISLDNKNKKVNYYKRIAFITSILNLIVSLIIYILFDFSNNQFQFIQEHYDLSFYDIYLGVDGISIYFVLLTTIIMPIALMSN